MTRDELVGRLAGRFDVLVVGGGATGLGTAVDALLRGYRTALVEASDFAKATSSRSSKLVHGGVRYLRSGQIGLVREALHERAILRRNAAHLVDELGFICPLYRRFEGPYYFAGFKLYDLLAGKANFHASAYLGRAQTLDRLPDLKRAGLHGSIRYYDGQFDDARLALALARTALDLGGAVLNYARAERLLYEGERVCGALVREAESGREFELRAKVVVNATGIFADELRALDDASAKPLLSRSRGAHVVFPKAAFRGSDALLVPETDDGRVLFLIPWKDHVVFGTTDVPVARSELEPAPTRAEVDFIIAQANNLLQKPVGRGYALAAYAGLRPLVSGAAASTAKLSREHVIEVAKSGLVTICGGKWTTYRKMAQDTVDAAAREGKLAAAPSRSALLSLHGNPGLNAAASGGPYAIYGSDAGELSALEASDPALRERIHPRLPYTHAEVVYAAREELARTVDDVLARRTRALLLDAEAAREAAPAVAALLALELGRDGEWQAQQLADFGRIAAANLAPIR
ncbi:MAG: glycerol-3-phosphate dehydrogenase/oxidase [Vulcanimicrobiaceae bacterium]